MKAKTKAKVKRNTVTSEIWYHRAHVGQNSPPPSLPFPSGSLSLLDNGLLGPNRSPSLDHGPAAHLASRGLRRGKTVGMAKAPQPARLEHRCGVGSRYRVEAQNAREHPLGYR